MKTRISIIFAALAAAGLWFAGSQVRMQGKYVDPGRNYIEFQWSGKAFTNISSGGGETEITYDRDGDRVTLHEIDGNPTLRVQRDGTLCCGPGGALRPAH